MIYRLMLLWALLTSATVLVAQDTGPAKNDPSVPKDRDTVLRIQIFLDKHLFGPGKLDGAIGEFTYKAVVNYNYSRGHKDLYNWDHVKSAAEAEVPVIFAAYKVKADVLKYINKDLPDDPEKQSEFPYMAYRSLSELVAERFHTDESFLAKINPGKNIDAMKAGAIIVVPNIRSFKIEEVKAMQTFATDKTLAARTIVVDTVERMAAIYTPDEEMIAAFPITPGKPQFIPTGVWKIQSMMTTPSFRYDKKFLEEGVRGDEAFHLPPGPNSPIGVIWCGLSKSGIGLHGTAQPRTIGRTRSAGCVRLANWDAIRLPGLIRPGAKVIVK
ncbi:MAG: L,D-transpeptidase [Verrucomicrobiaceae bacterium]|nr:L,D-transpeptidase [Verrucomicrobiaceae bacterium]